MKQLIAKGEKILLRKYQLSDAFEDTKIWKNRKVSMWILDYSLPYNLKDARKWIKNILKNKKNYYAVLSKDSGNLIGAIWINHKKNKNGELEFLIIHCTFKLCKSSLNLQSAHIISLYNINTTF